MKIKTKKALLPRLQELSRRDFIRLASLAGTVALTSGVIPFTAVNTAGAAPADPAAFSLRLELTTELSQSPAFTARALPDGGAIVWVRKPDDSVLAYGLNKEGRQVWEMCDGVRNKTGICRELSASSGAEEKTVRRFIEDLEEKGLVVSGGYLTAPKGFPYDPDTRRYMHRL